MLNNWCFACFVSSSYTKLLYIGSVLIHTSSFPVAAQKIGNWQRSLLYLQSENIAALIISMFCLYTGYKSSLIASLTNMLYFIISPQCGLFLYSLSVTMRQLMQELKLQELDCIPVPYYHLQPCKTRPKASQTYIYSKCNTYNR